MRIVHVIRQFEPSIGGMEAVAKNLALQQIAQGHAVEVVTLNRVFGTSVELAGHEVLNGIPVTRLPFRGSSRYPLAWSVIKHLKGFDLVHVHGVDFFFDFLAITKIWHKKTMVVSTHGGFFHTEFASRLKKVFFNTVTRWNVRKYAFIAASSRADYELFRRLRSSGIGLFENGVDCSKFAGIKRQGVPRQLIYFGRFAPHKKLESLFPFLTAMRNLDPEWRLLIAGRPWGVTAEELHSKACAEGLQGAVDFLESPSDEELRCQIGRSSVFVSASAYEGFGIAVLEALSAGLFVAASDIQAHRHTLGLVKNAALLDFNDPAKAAEAVLRQFDCLMRTGTAVESAQQALKPYSWAAAATRFEHLYESVLGRSERLILSTRVKNLTQENAIVNIRTALHSRNHVKIAFVNAHLALEAAKDASVASALNDFLLLNDGVGADIASRVLFKEKFCANLNGTDFTPQLLDRCDVGLNIFLLGATVDVIGKAAAYYAERWPQHKVVGSYHGYFSSRDETAVAYMIKSAKPDLVLVGMGCPRQELWIARNIPSVCAVGIGVGALFDFQTDKVPRASPLIRSVRAEWLFRLAVEPRRLTRRYLIGNALFLGRVGRQWSRGERA